MLRAVASPTCSRRGLPVARPDSAARAPRESGQVCLVPIACHAVDGASPPGRRHSFDRLASDRRYLASGEQSEGLPCFPCATLLWEPKAGRRSGGQPITFEAGGL